MLRPGQTEREAILYLQRSMMTRHHFTMENIEQEDRKETY